MIQELWNSVFLGFFPAERHGTCLLLLNMAFQSQQSICTFDISNFISKILLAVTIFTSNGPTSNADNVKAIITRNHDHKPRSQSGRHPLDWSFWLSKNCCLAHDSHWSETSPLQSQSSDTTRNEERSKMQTLLNILQEKASRPTVLYLHGVAHTRGYPHRVDLYKVGHEGTTSCYHFMII